MSLMSQSANREVPHGGCSKIVGGLVLSDLRQHITKRAIIRRTFFCEATSLASAFRFLDLTSDSFPGAKSPSFSAAAAARSAADGIWVSPKLATCFGELEDIMSSLT